MHKNRKAFTLLEVVFVVAIVGILASVAIPKIQASRDDAKMVAEITNLTTCINDVGNGYSATAVLFPSTASELGALYSSCKIVNDSGCFGLSGQETNLTVSALGSSDTCQKVILKATSKNLVGVHQFGASSVVE